MGRRHNPGILDTIHNGMRVTIVDRFGKTHSGKAVIRGPHGWVLNMGGPHGTPGIATPENIVKVAGKPSGIGGLAITGRYGNPRDTRYAVVRFGDSPRHGTIFESVSLAKKYQKKWGKDFRIVKLNMATGEYAESNPGPSAIPAKWTPATVSRKGGQIQIRMGGRK